MSRGLALRSGLAADGMPVHTRMKGSCPGLYKGYRGHGLFTGRHSSGKPILAWARQWCQPGSTQFQRGERYLGLVTGTKNGKPVIASWCEACEQVHEYSSSSFYGSTPPGGHSIPCCPGILLGDCLTFVISGGTIIDGTYTLNWNASLNTWRSVIYPHPCAGLKPIAETIRFYSNGCSVTITNDEGLPSQSPGPIFPQGGSGTIQCTPYICVFPALSYYVDCLPFSFTTTAMFGTLTEC